MNMLFNIVATFCALFLVLLIGGIITVEIVMGSF